MPERVVLPIGIIQRVAGDHATVALTLSPAPDWLTEQAPATVWCRHPSNLATAKLRGYVSKIDGETATFTVVATMVDPHWPTDQEPLQPNGWVYLAQPDSFEPDLSATVNEEEPRKMLPEQPVRQARLPRYLRKTPDGCRESENCFASPTERYPAGNYATANTILRLPKRRVLKPRSE